MQLYSTAYQPEHFQHGLGLSNGYQHAKSARCHLLRVSLQAHLTHHALLVQTEASLTQPAIIAMQGRSNTYQAVSDSTVFCKIASWPPPMLWQLRFGIQHACHCPHQLTEALISLQEGLQSWLGLTNQL